MAAVVLGRPLLDLANGWNGRPPNGEHAFVVNHEPPTDWAYRDTAPFTFVTDGVRSAIEQARAFAGDRDVTVTAGDIGGQAIREDLIDQVVLNLVPASSARADRSSARAAWPSRSCSRIPGSCRAGG
jgi:dihydrofolate reductase